MTSARAGAITALRELHAGLLKELTCCEANERPGLHVALQYVVTGINALSVEDVFINGAVDSTQPKGILHN